MKREIKFRAWIGEQMIGWDNLKSLRYAIDNENAVVMQYTGLKDKSGKEIYEGDIVKRIELDCDKTEHESIYFVLFNDACFCLEAVKSHFLRKGANCRIFEELEIIGNIYENEELLKQ